MNGDCVGGACPGLTRAQAARLAPGDEYRQHQGDYNGFVGHDKQLSGNILQNLPVPR
ncbi:MAG: hypothetical protein FWD79_01790 [Desulfobulbus sp.]|nr:hypothetical protein [Desulfobulbus sp.]